MKGRQSIVYAIVVLSALIDRIIKQITPSTSTEGVLLTREYAGLVQLDDVLGKGLAIAICVGVGVHALFSRSRSRAPHVAILLGAASNLFDRFMYSGVIDWLVLPMVRINGADILIIGGAIMLLVQEMKAAKK